MYAGHVVTSFVMQAGMGGWLQKIVKLMIFTEQINEVYV